MKKSTRQPAPAILSGVLSPIGMRNKYTRNLLNAAADYFAHFPKSPDGWQGVAGLNIRTKDFKTPAEAVVAFATAHAITNGGTVVFDPRNEVVLKRKDETRSAWDKLGEALSECIYSRLTKEQRDAWVAMATLYAIHRDENGGEE